jgi:hypothetical protein
MTYYRLFPLIMQDFITRADMQELLLPTNLIISAQAGPAPVVGTIQAIQNGASPGAGSQTLKQAKEALKQSGGAAINASLGALGNV